jgi:hypothetical protein
MIGSLEEYGMFAVLAGLLLLVVGYVWIVVRAHRKKVRGRVFFVAFPPVAPLYAALHPRRFTVPLLVFLLGVVLAGSPYAINAAGPYLIHLGDRDKIVDGERHLTLTGWDQSNYATVLNARPDAVVVQMANPDVNDATVALLKHLPNIRELDLSSTVVTDGGLEALAGLTKLERLWLRHTAITDEGFRAHIAPLPALRNVDVSDTTVSVETLAAWRAAKPGRRAIPAPHRSTVPPAASTAPDPRLGEGSPP